MYSVEEADIGKYLLRLKKVSAGFPEEEKLGLGLKNREKGVRRGAGLARRRFQVGSDDWICILEKPICRM